MINIVLYTPEIPQNTGNIGRLCVCTNAKLHLIEPLGFSLDEKSVRRAGLDYWPNLDHAVYANWKEFIKTNNPENMHFISTKGTKYIYEEKFEDNLYLVFGCEGSGLPKEFYETYNDKMLLIPMPGEHSRSLNLANSVSIVLYEAMRQLNFS